MLWWARPLLLIAGSVTLLAPAPRVDPPAPPRAVWRGYLELLAGGGRGMPKALVGRRGAAVALNKPYGWMQVRLDDSEEVVFWRNRYVKLLPEDC
jgi:hypothetical protein